MAHRITRSRRSPSTKKDDRVRVVDLSRNFGHHKAMLTGLMYAQGDLIFLIDVDLEEPPEALATFYEKFRNNDVDVVYGVQAYRQARGLIGYPEASFIFCLIFVRLHSQPSQRA